MAEEKRENKLDEQIAATKIKATFKGFLARKNYAIKQLPNSNLTDYKVFIRGNDPDIDGLPHHENDEQIALIGTSGMRSVETACQLSSGATKLIIIDNSQKVVEFWRHARELMKHTHTKLDFILSLSMYLDKAQCAMALQQREDIIYLTKLFDRFGFEKIKKIISSITVLAQSWADKEILFKIKNILSITGINTIYVYPSNIVAYLYASGEKENARQVLENIQALNPILAIHSDLVNNCPEKIVMIDDHRPENVEAKLNLALDNRQQVNSRLVQIGLLALLEKRNRKTSPDKEDMACFKNT